MRPVTSSIDGAESSSTEEGAVSRPAALPSKDFVGAAAYLACQVAAQVRLPAPMHHSGPLSLCCDRLACEARHVKASIQQQS